MIGLITLFFFGGWAMGAELSSFWKYPQSSSSAEGLLFSLGGLLLMALFLVAGRWQERQGKRPLGMPFSSYAITISLAYIAGVVVGVVV